MPVHPVETDPLLPSEGEKTAQNPTHLPVEPEFGPMLPPAEPEDAGARPPHI